MGVIALYILLVACVLASAYLIVASVFGLPGIKLPARSPMSASMANMLAALLFLALPLKAPCRELELRGWGWPLVGTYGAACLACVVVLIVKTYRQTMAGKW